VPLSDYARFSLWVAQFNTEAGEDIRYLGREDAAKLDLPNHDYWLFDSRKLLHMQFGEDRRFVGAEVIEDVGAIVQHNYWRDAARHHAMIRDEFVTKYDQRDYKRR
jgi:hypothetical protein